MLMISVLGIMDLFDQGIACAAQGRDCGNRKQRCRDFFPFEFSATPELASIYVLVQNHAMLGAMFFTNLSPATRCEVTMWVIDRFFCIATGTSNSREFLEV
jgi:hypothetical protein